MKIQNTPYLLILTLFILSCSQLGDSLRLPGEDPKDIIYYELNNDYLAPESRDFIEQNFPSLNVNTSYILIGKNTYGFEADLTNDKSLSFDEDGIFKFDREHPFLKDNYEKGKYGGGKREGKDEGEGKDESEGKDKGEGEDREKDEDGKDKTRERCFDFVMPYNLMMPDSSVITISTEGDNEKIENWYKDNPNEEKSPMIQFPVDIYFDGDEKEATINSRKELKDALESCEEYEKEKEECFTIVMPYSIQMPDSSVIIISSEEDRDKVKEWHENNPKSEGRHKLIFPVELLFEGEKDGEEEVKTITVNDSDEMKEIISECRRQDKKGKGKGKDKKDWCKKLDESEIDDCIIEYVNTNYPEDKIVHSRTIQTKDNVVIHVVKLQKAGILKFGEDCEFID